MRDHHFTTNVHSSLQPRTSGEVSVASMCEGVDDEHSPEHHFDLNIEIHNEHPWSAGYDVFAESVGSAMDMALPHPSNVADSVDSSIHHTVGQVFNSAAIRNPLQPYQNAPGGASRGSCFVVDTSQFPGLGGGTMMLTNHHVVKDQVRLEVGFPAYGNRRFEASIVATAPQKDMALIRISDSASSASSDCQLRPYQMGDSDRLTDAVSVVAEGYPLGQTSCKVTQGTLSGIQTLRGSEFLQHTAFLNGGNSGGPLCVQTPMGKRVIGMNSMIIKGGRGMNYAIPINAIRKFMEKVQYNGTTVFLRSPYLGLFCQPSNANQTALLNNPDGGGYYVNHVVTGSVAAQGLQKGDQICMVDGFSVDMTGSTRVDWSPSTPIGMNQYLSRKYLGDTATFQVYRNGASKPTEVNVEFTDENQFAIRSVFAPFERYDYEVIGGMVVQQLTQNHIALLFKSNMFLSKFMYPDNLLEPRLIVTHLFPGSVSERQHVFGIGSILESVNGAPVRTMDSLRKQFIGAKAKFFQFTSDLDSDLVLTHRDLEQSDSFCSLTYNVPASELIPQMGLVGASANHLYFEHNVERFSAARPVGTSEASRVNVNVNVNQAVSTNQSFGVRRFEVNDTHEECSVTISSLEADLQSARDQIAVLGDVEGDLTAAREENVLATEEVSSLQVVLQSAEDQLAAQECELEGLRSALTAARATADDSESARIEIEHERHTQAAHVRHLQEELHGAGVADLIDVAASDQNQNQNQNQNPSPPVEISFDEFLVNAPQNSAASHIDLGNASRDPALADVSLDALTDPLGLMQMT